jgi:hypothetical protein
VKRDQGWRDDTPKESTDPTRNVGVWGTDRIAVAAAWEMISGIELTSGGKPHP